MKESGRRGLNENRRRRTNTKTARSTGLRGQTRHDCASDDVARHASFLRATAKSDPRGALTSELFSWRRTWKYATHATRCWMRIVYRCV